MIAARPGGLPRRARDRRRRRRRAGADPTVERRDVDLGSETRPGALAEACRRTCSATPPSCAWRATPSRPTTRWSPHCSTPPAPGRHPARRAPPGRGEGPRIVDGLAKGPGFTLAPARRPRAAPSTTSSPASCTGHGRRATPDAVEALRVAIGDDLRALPAAVSQLASDVESDPLTADRSPSTTTASRTCPGYLCPTRSSVAGPSRSYDAPAGPSRTTRGRPRALRRRRRGAPPAWPGGLDPPRDPGRRGRARGRRAPVQGPHAARAGRPLAPGGPGRALGRAGGGDAAVKGRDAVGRAMVEDGLDREQGSLQLERRAAAHRPAPAP